MPIVARLCLCLDSVLPLLAVVFFTCFCLSVCLLTRLLKTTEEIFIE